MKVSIITATLNSESTLQQCLESVRSQTWPNIEHIVVDGGSEDGTIEILQKERSLTCWLSQSDKGIYDALNKGLLLATGEIIGFLHSDDTFYNQHTIKRIVNAFCASLCESKEKHIHGVYGDLQYLNQSKPCHITRSWKSKTFQTKYLQYGWTPPHPSLFLRKEVYAKHGFFDTNYRISGDYDLMLRILNDPTLNFRYLKGWITLMRQGGISTGRTKNILLKKKEDLYALSQNGFRFPAGVVLCKNLRKIPQVFWR